MQEAALRRFVEWSADVAKITKIDVYRADYGGSRAAQRHTAPYYFTAMEDFIWGQAARGVKTGR